MSTPEGKVKAKLKAALLKDGAYWFMPVQTGLGATTLDFIVCRFGEFHGYECKAPGKKLTPRQELVSRQIRAAGGAAYMVTVDKDGELVFERCGLTGNDSS